MMMALPWSKTRVDEATLVEEKGVTMSQGPMKQVLCGTATISPQRLVIYSRRTTGAYPWMQNAGGAMILAMALGLWLYRRT
jgi:hypothetical protein